MPGARVIPTHSESSIAVGDGLLGRVLDGAAGRSTASATSSARIACR